MKQNNTKTQLEKSSVFATPRTLSSVALFVFSLLSFVFCFVFSLLSSISFSTPTHATSLSLSVEGLVSLDAVPTDTTGVFTSSTSSISVSTNNYTGYTLGISASTVSGGTTSNGNALKNTLDSNITIPSLTQSTTATNYATDTSLNNTWGILPSYYHSTANTTNYYPAPSSNTTSTVLNTTSSPNATNSHDDYTITVGTRVNLNKAPGAYNNTFVITAIANGAPYTITYNQNTTDTVSNMPANETSGMSYADTVTLSSTIPTRTGYTFLGWCASNASETQCGADGTGTIYSATNNNLDQFPIDRTASNNGVNVYAIWSVKSYSLTLTFAGTGVSSVKICLVSGNCSGTNLVGTVSTSGSSVQNLTYNTAYYLYPSFTTGYGLSSWSKTSTAGTLSSTSATNPTFTMGDGNGAVTITGKAKTYTLTLTNTNATTNGSTKARVTYNSNVVYGGTSGTNSITNPSRAYTISFDANSTDATLGTTSKTYTYTFDGWYTSSTGGNRIITSGKALVASTSYTNSEGKWTSTSSPTLYAHWTNQSFTMPSLTKDGHSCSWNTSADGSGTTYTENTATSSYAPTAASTLYAICEATDYTLTLTAGTGTSALTATGWTNSGTATISKTVHIGDVINLSTITPTFKTGYNTVGYTKTDNIGSLSGSTYTVGAGSGAVTIKATALDTPVCTMQGGATKIYNRSATTLTATSNASNYDTSSATITYSFGYATSTTATLDDFGAAQSGNTISIAKAAFYGTRYYGVKVTVTDNTDSTITNTCTSGTGSSTSTTVANRTTMSLVNAVINFDANGGTLSGTNPVYTAYGKSASTLYTTRTGTTAASLPTVTPPEGHTLNGWYDASTGGNKVLNADGSLTGTAVSGWSNASSQWIITSTSTTTKVLYAQYDASTYTCTKQYALQNADGTYPSYTVESTEQVAYGSTCSYSKSVNYYTTQSTSGTMGTSGLTLSLQLPRTTYALTVNRNTAYISSVTGAGTYRWGQSVSISATPATNSKFTSWSQTSGTTSSFGSTTSATTTFTMPKSAATIYADGESSKKIYLQDMTLNDCMKNVGTNGNAANIGDNITVYDKRTSNYASGDDGDYTVRYINGQCWMTQNLRIRGTISAADSNFTGSDFNVSQYDLQTNGSSECYGYGSGNANNYAGLTHVCSKNTTTKSTGAWYNYCAASAGTVCFNSDSSNVVNDICPSGWHLPTGPNATSGSDFNILLSSSTYAAAFGGVGGGYYYNGSINYATYGYWWSATANGEATRFYLDYSGSNNSLVGNRSTNRYIGLFARCVMK